MALESSGAGARAKGLRRVLVSADDSCSLLWRARRTIVVCIVFARKGRLVGEAGVSDPHIVHAGGELLRSVAGWLHASASECLGDVHRRVVLDADLSA